MLKADLEAILHMPCTVRAYTGAERLPLFLRGGYAYWEIQMGTISFLAVQPEGSVPLATLRKHRAVLAERTGMECVFVMEQMTSYQKKKMIEDNVPFVRHPA